jgi:transcription-repair coupling factor (superfamily II helicase)
MKIDSAIEIPVTAYFPTFYIADEETRVELYSRLARCSDTALLDEIRDECEDRFGRLPEEAKGLFIISRLRILAASVGVKKVTRVINHLRFEFADARLPDIGRLFKNGGEILRQIYFEPKDKNTINLNIIDDSDEDVFGDAIALLQVFDAIRQQDEIKEAEIGENAAEIL